MEIQENHHKKKITLTTPTFKILLIILQWRCVAHIELLLRVQFELVSRVEVVWWVPVPSPVPQPGLSQPKP